MMCAIACGAGLQAGGRAGLQTRTVGPSAETLR